MNKLLQLSTQATQFECDIYDADGNVTGKETYYVEDLLSIDRYRQLRKFQNEIATGLTHFDLIQLLKNNVANLNKAMGGGEVLAQMAFENINALNHAGNLEAKEPFEVWICTLFCNTKDEDRRKFEVPVMQQKIRNWEGAGIEIDFFISLAETLLGVPAGALRSPILSFSDQTPGMEMPSETNNPIDPIGPNPDET